MMVDGFISGLFATSLFKALVIAMVVFLAHKWSVGDFDKPLKNLKQIGKEYGFITILLIVAWWILTPSGTPDDLLMIWFIGIIGVVNYFIGLALLTVYIIWRLKVTFVIYRSK